MRKPNIFKRITACAIAGIMTLSSMLPATAVNTMAATSYTSTTKDDLFAVAREMESENAALIANLEDYEVEVTNNNFVLSQTSAHGPRTLSVLLPRSKVPVRSADGTATFTNVCKITYNNAGYLPDGTWFDIIYTLDSLSLNGALVTAAYPDDCEFLEVSAGTRSGALASCSWLGVSRLTPYGHDYNYSVQIVTKDGTPIDDISLPILFKDLDITTDRTSQTGQIYREGITLVDGFDRNTYTQTGSYLRITQSGARYDSTLETPDTNDPKSAVLTQVVSPNFKLEWHGCTCSTYLSPNSATGQFATIDKSVDEAIADRGDIIHYTIPVNFSYTNEYNARNSIEVVDELASVLKAEDATIASVTATSTAGTWEDKDNWDVEISGQTVTVISKSPEDVGGLYQFKLNVPIREDADFTGYRSYEEGDMTYYIVPNKAELYINDANDNTIEVETDVPVTFSVPMGRIQLEKDVDKTEIVGASAGDVLNYTFKITNTGNSPLRNVYIDDELQGISNITYDWSTVASGRNTMKPYEVAYATATYTLTQADIDAQDILNEAVVYGSDELNKMHSSRDDAETILSEAPHISIEKSVDKTNIARPKPGDKLVYSFEITNTGNVTLTDVTFTDNMTIEELNWAESFGTLAPGQSVTGSAKYTLTQDDIMNGFIDNGCDISGISPAGTTVTDHDNAITMLQQVAAIGHTKETPETFIPAERAVVDYVVPFTFTISNNGNVPLYSVGMSDRLTGVYDLVIDWTTANEVGTLLPGETVNATASYKLTQADIEAGQLVNWSDAFGVDANGNELTAPATVTIALANNPPSIRLTKDVAYTLLENQQNPNPEYTGTISTGQYSISNAFVGMVIPYTFVGTNTGDKKLVNVEITDHLAGVSAISYTWPRASEPGVLEPGESVNATATYTLTQEDIDRGTLDNEATIKGYTQKGQEVTDDDTHGDNFPKNPAISIVKNTTVTSVSNAVAGRTRVPYTFTVANAGNVTLHDVAFTDDHNIRDLGWESAIDTLTPGQAVNGTGYYILTQDDISRGYVKNTANVEGTSPDNEKVTDSDDARTDIAQNQELTLVKTVDKTKITNAKVGDLISYEIKSKNNGNVTLKDVTLTDSLTGNGLSEISYSWPGAEGVLEPGQTLTATATYAVTQNDINIGLVENTAHIEGYPDVAGNPDPVIPEDSTVQTVLEQKAVISVVKTVDKTFIENAAVGQILNYTFTVSNPGNVTLTNIVLDDALDGISNISITWPGEDGTLLPGEEAQGTATYALKQGDVEAGFVENTVIVTGFDPKGNAVTDDSAVSTNLGQDARISVVKSVDKLNIDEATAGQVLNYSFEITNPGNVTLTEVVLTDSLAGISEISYNWPGSDGVLLPGETATATATYAITQADINAGKVDNAVTAKGKDPNGRTLQDDSSITTTLAQSAQIDVEKSVDKSRIRNAAAGQVLNYTFEVTNVGNVTLTNVKLVDQLEDISELNITWPHETGVLAPGEAAQATATYALKQSDIDAGNVENIVVATGKDPGGNTVEDTARANTDIDRNAAISVTKNVDKTEIENATAGERLNYTFEVTNVGSVVLRNVALDDALDGISGITMTWPGTRGVLAPGEAATGTASYTVKQSDINKGSVKNVVTATSEDPAGGTVSDEDNVTTVLGQSAEISVEKSVDKTDIRNAAVGQKLNYTFEITNPGTVALTDVALDDRLAGISEISITWPGAPGVLNPADSAQATAAYTITQADIDRGYVKNTVIATGKDPQGNTVRDDSEVNTDLGQSPAIRVKKTVDKEEVNNASAGDVLHYAFEVTNTGNVTLTDVALGDVLAGISALQYTWPGEAGVLKVGETAAATATYAIKQADIEAGEVVNAVTATGRDPKGNEVHDDDEVGTVLGRKADISITKTVDKERVENAEAGQKLTYSFEVENTGNVTLTNVALSDALEGISAISMTWPANEGVLRAGEVAQGTATYTLKQSDVESGNVVNTVMVMGKDPRGNTVSDDDEARTELVYNASISIEKDVDKARIENAVAGQRLTYTFTVTNNGSVTLKNIVLADALDGISDISMTWPTAAGTLKPGEEATGRATYTVKQSDVEGGEVVNTVTVTGKDPGGQTVRDTDDAETELEQAPHITIVKSVDKRVIEGATAGQKLNYTFTVTNSGNVTLTNIALADDLNGLSDIDMTWPAAANTLKVGEVTYGSAAYTLTQADIDSGDVKNVVHVTGTAPNGSTVTDDSTVNTELGQAPGIAVVKTVDKTDVRNAKVGDALNYTFAISNPGNVTLTNVKINDALDGISGITYTWPGAEGVLVPGGTARATATYALTQADINRGDVKNTVVATGKAPDGSTVQDESDVSTELEQKAVISVTKNVDKTFIDNAVAGQKLTYTFTVSNPGNLPLTNVTLDDELRGISNIVMDWPGSAGVLRVGESATGTAAYTVKQSDIEAGSIENIVVATGKDPKGETVTDDASVDTELMHNASVSITKTVDKAAVRNAEEGQKLTYTFVVTNTGNVTLKDITLTDELEDISNISMTWPGSDNVLKPGEEARGRASYNLKQSDIDEGFVENIVRVTGKDPTGQRVQDDDSVSTDIVADPLISVEKRVDKTLLENARAGQKLGYTFVVTNTGNVTLTKVALDDALDGISDIDMVWLGRAGTLKPGDTARGMASYTVTQADINAGKVTNAVAATGTAPDGTKVRDESTVKTDITSEPKIAIVKSVDKTEVANAAAGQNLTYTFVITNKGNVTLTNVSLDDSLDGISDIDIAWAGREGVLMPGDAVEGTATYKVKQSDINNGSVTNTVEVKGTAPDGREVKDDSEVTTDLEIRGQIEVVKTVDKAVLENATAGQKLNYTFTVTNTGNATLSSVTLTDQLAGISEITMDWPGSAGVLRVGESATGHASYALKQSDVESGSVENIVVVTGKDPKGGIVRDDDSVSTDVRFSSGISIEKTVDKAVVDIAVAGQKLTYTFVVTNMGAVTLKNVTLTDKLEGISAISMNWPGAEGVLKPGEEARGRATYSIKQSDIENGDVENVVSVTGRDSRGDTVRDNDSVTSELVQAPHITVVKSVDKRSIENATAGQKLGYTFVITNSGNVTLRNVMLDDALDGISDITITWAGTDNVLRPGETAHGYAAYTVKQSDIDTGKVRNLVTATGIAPGGEKVSDKSEVETELGQKPQISVVKSVDKANIEGAQPGDVLTYTFAISNPGNVTLTDIALTDELNGISGITYTWPGSEGVLKPGETAKATATYALTQADINRGDVKNTVIATGKTPDGTKVQDDSDVSTDVGQKPQIAVTKTVDKTRVENAKAGQKLNYTFTVSNPGNVPLKDVALADALDGISVIAITWPGDTGVLNVGESANGTATYTIRQSDIERGNVENTVVASGKSPKGVTVEDEATANSELMHNASISVAKTVDKTRMTDAVAGQKLGYTFVITNTGNVTLKNVELEDALDGISYISITWPGSEGTLKPGEEARGKASYTLKQSDIDSGNVENLVKATGRTPTGYRVQDSDDVNTEIEPAPSITVIKSVDRQVLEDAEAGMKLTYTFTATNSGNVTLKNVVLDDSLDGISNIRYTWPDRNGILKPGERAAGIATYTITQSDIDAGEVVNAVIATGTALDNTTVQDDDDVITDIEQYGSIKVEKKVDKENISKAAAGQKLNYTFTITNNGNVTLKNVGLDDALDGLSTIRYNWPGRDGILKPGEKATAAATYTLTQSDINSGSVTNYVLADGRTPDNRKVEDDDDVTTQLEQNPKIAVTKDVDKTSIRNAAAGDTLSYTFRISNKGNVTLYNVELDDTLDGIGNIAVSWPGEEGTLNPGEEATGRATYALKQSDIDAGSVTNYVLATGEDLSGKTVTDDDDADTRLEQNPGIEVVKTVDKAELRNAEAGQKLFYNFVIRNTGNTTLTHIVLDDELEGISNINMKWTGEDGVLAPGEEAQATAFYTVKQSDIDAGNVENYVTVTGKDPNGKTVDDDSETDTVIEQTPKIAVVKTVDKARLANTKAGQKLTYTFVISNQGNVTLNKIALDDALDGISDIVLSYPAQTGVLRPGEAAEGKATYTVTQDDVDAGIVKNFVHVTGKDPNGDTVEDDSDAMTDIEQVPGISVTKAVDKTFVENAGADQKLNYTFVITNTGNVTLKNVALDDALEGISDIRIEWKDKAGVLKPGETAEGKAVYRLKQSDIDAGNVENTVTASGTDPDGDEIHDDARVNTDLEQIPVLEIVKTVDKTDIRSASVGQELAYTFVISNKGNVTISGIELDDALDGISDIHVNWPGRDGVLKVGETAEASATYVLTLDDINCGDVKNFVTATGKAPNGDTLRDDSDTNTDLEQIPNVLVVKEVDKKEIAKAKAGDVLIYAFRVTNTGNVTLTRTALEDALDGISEISITWPGETGVLNPGETAQGEAAYTVTQADVDEGFVENFVTVKAEDPRKRPLSGDSKVFTELGQAPDIDITKTVDKEEIARAVAGDRLTYSFLIENTGNVTLTGISITDDLDGISDIAFTWPGKDGTLAPGKTAKATATYILTQADVDRGDIINTVSVTGKAPNGDTVKDDDNAATVLGQDPHISIVKTVDKAELKDPHAGDELSYSFVVSNTGNVTISKISLADRLEGITDIAVEWKNKAGVLAPNETAEAKATYKLTQADIDSGRITNAVIAHGEDPSGEPVDDDSDATTKLQRNPDISVVKTVDKEKIENAKAGQKLRYTFEVRNTGNMTLQTIYLVDKLSGISEIAIKWPGKDGVLLPGETAKGSAGYTVTQDDIDRGSVPNTVTAFGEDPLRDPVSDKSTVDTELEQNPEIQIDKSVDMPKVKDAKAGQVLTYTFIVRNTGNVTIRNIVLDDKLDGVSGIAMKWPASEGVLKPGEKAIGTAAYAMTQSDINAGSVTNAVLATGTDPKEDPVEDAAEVSSKLEQKPGIRVEKTVDKPEIADAEAGMRLAYSFLVTNTGNVTLTDIELDDKLDGISPVSVTWTDGTGVLNPGETAEGTAEYFLTQSDIDRGEVENIVVATGKDPKEGEVKSDDSVKTELVQNPDIYVVKAVDQSEVKAAGAGLTLTYTFEFGNSGNVTLTNVTLDDKLEGISGLEITWDGKEGVLAPGEKASAKATYAMAQSDIDRGSIANLVMITGKDPKGGSVEDSSQADTSLERIPGISVMKTVDTAELKDAKAGQELTYTFTVTNTGNVTLTKVELDDRLDGISGIKLNKKDGSLKPGDVMSGTATYKLKQSDIDSGNIENVVFVTAKDPEGNPVDDDANVKTVLEQKPAITVEKTVDRTAIRNAAAGEELEYAFNVTNTGNVTLTDITLTDELDGISDIAIKWPDKEGILAPGQAAKGTATYALKQSDIDSGDIQNVVLVNGKAPNGDTVKDDSKVKTELEKAPAIAVKKTVDETELKDAKAGHVLHYTFKVTNTGNVTLTDIHLDDKMEGVTDIEFEWRGAEGELRPDESVIAEASYAITQADINRGSVENTVIAAAKDPDGEPVDDTSSVVTELDMHPLIKVEKTVDKESMSKAAVGDKLTYTFKVTNTGNVTIKEVTLQDELKGISSLKLNWKGEAGTLEPNESVTGTATYTLTQADIDNGSVVNKVTVTGKDPKGESVTGEAEAKTTILYKADFSVTKTVDKTSIKDAKEGTVLTYTFTGKNNGDVTLKDVSFEDKLNGISTLTYKWPDKAGILAPGETVTAQATYRITREDISRGYVENTVLMRAKTPDGKTPEPKQSIVKTTVTAPEPTPAMPTNTPNAATPRAGTSSATTSSAPAVQRTQSQPASTVTTAKTTKTGDDGIMAGFLLLMLGAASVTIYENRKRKAR